MTAKKILYPLIFILSGCGLVFNGCASTPPTPDPVYQEMENRISKMEQTTRAELDQLWQKVNSLSQPIIIEKPAPAPPAAPPAPAQTASPPKPAAPAPSEPPATAATPQAPPAEDARAKEIQEIEDLFSEGQILFINEDYEGAIELFEKLVKNHPNHNLAPEAAYQVGECYYSQKKYQRAVTEYDQLINRWPDAPNAPDAQLKKAYAYSMMKNGNMAMVELNKLLKNYPKSKAAALVRQGKTIFKVQ